MLQIRVANPNDYLCVRDFYYDLINLMEDAEFKPGWERDVYPSQEFLIQSIRNGELFVGEADGRIVSCMVVNHEYNAGYRDIPWSIDAKDSELLVIHALGVHPAYSGRGIAKQMVQYVIDIARKDQIRTIRLDVLEGNVPAERAYSKMGFTHRGTIRMFYEDTGWTNFKLFEVLL